MKLDLWKKSCKKIFYKCIVNKIQIIKKMHKLFKKYFSF